MIYHPSISFLTNKTLSLFQFGVWLGKENLTVYVTILAWSVSDPVFTQLLAQTSTKCLTWSNFWFCSVFSATEPNFPYL